MNTEYDYLRKFFLGSFLFFSCLVTQGVAQDSELVEIDELAAAVARAKSGANLVVKGGEFADRDLVLSGRGGSNGPITISVAQGESLILTGSSSLRVDGEFLVISGFYFKGGNCPRKDVIRIDGKGCRLVNCVIENVNPPSKPDETSQKWVSLFGINHIVENCTFRGKASHGALLTIWREEGKEEQHIIRRNHFLDRPKGRKGNGYETIRLGTSDESMSDSKSIIESNLFERCDGEMEIVSIKAGKAVVKGNTFSECAGTLTLRHGNGSKAESNLFIGKGKKETGAIRIYGNDHSIINNVAIGTTGRSGGAISLMTGNQNPDLHEYHVAERILIDGNLLVANKGPAIKLDCEYNGKDRHEVPKGIFFRGNILSGADPKSLIEGGENLPSGSLKWENNQIFQDNQIPREITRTISPPLSAAEVGAVWYRSRLP